MVCVVMKTKQNKTGKNTRKIIIIETVKAHSIRDTDFDKIAKVQEPK